MELIPEETKFGDYYVFENDEGERFVLLEGLDHNQVHEPGGFETFMLNNYDTFATFYSVLAFVTFVYLIGRYIVYPLYQQGR